MSRPRIHHPEEEELLRLADGELPARRAGEVRSHLEACWQCRAGFEELQKVIGECVRYRKSVLESCLPPPPAPWPDIHRPFAEIDTARERNWLVFPRLGVWRWAPLAAALALIGVVYYQLRETPAVQAAALLKKAVAAADALPPKPRRIRIRTSRSTLERVVNARRALPVAAEEIPLETLFRAARYSWDDPLSARSFQTWRNQLPDGRDELTTTTTNYRIKTTTDSGELAEATLTLRTGDLQPVEGRLEFRNREWVEITEESGAAEPGPGPAASAPLAREAVRAVPPVPLPAAPGRELEVLAALHQVGADLGDPVEVTRDGDRILVSGLGLALERQQQIRGVLNPIPGVVVHFPQATPAAEPGRENPANAVAADPAPLQERIEKQLGGRVYFERLASQLLDMSDAMMARAYAMRRLAQRFPPGVEAQLNSPQRQLLGKLNQEHAAVLTRQTIEMERLVNPVLVSLGGAAAGAGALPADSWQTATEDLFRSARRVEVLIAAILGVAPADVPGERLPSQVLAGLARLRSEAEASERMAREFAGKGR
jgi:hypothetical protein